MAGQRGRESLVSTRKAGISRLRVARQMGWLILSSLTNIKMIYPRSLVAGSIAAKHYHLYMMAMYSAIGDEETGICSWHMLQLLEQDYGKSRKSRLKPQTTLEWDNCSVSGRMKTERYTCSRRIQGQGPWEIAAGCIN